MSEEKKPQVKRIIGKSHDVIKNLVFVGDSQVAYVCQKSCIFHNFDNSCQRIVCPSGDDIHRITAISVSHNFRYIGLAESANDGPSIKMWDLKHWQVRKSMKYESIRPNQIYVAINFSKEGKIISGLTRNSVEVWNWEQQTLISEFSLEHKSTIFEELFMCKLDSSLISISSPNIVTSLRITQSRISEVPLQNIPNKNMRCHLWLMTHKLIVGTDDGLLLLIEDFVYHESINVGAKIQKMTERKVAVHITALCATEKHIFCGTNVGYIIEFGLEYGHPDWERPELLRINSSSGINQTIQPISTMTTGEDQSILAISDSSNIYVAKYTTGHLKVFHGNLHMCTNDVIDVSVATTIPVTSILMKNNTLGVFDIITGMLHSSKQFDETVVSSQLHPNGLSIAVVTQKKVLFYYLLHDQFEPFGQVINLSHPPNQVCYANGGHLILIQTEPSVFGYCTMSFSERFNYELQKSCIKSLCWSSDDSICFINTENGSVIAYGITEKCVKWTFQQKAVQVIMMQTRIDSNAVMVLGSDSRLRQVSNGEVTNTILLNRAVASCFIYLESKQLLLLGTVNGAIWQVSYGKDVLTGESQMYDVHSTAVTHVRKLNRNFKNFADFMTVTDDGNIYFWKYKENETNADKIEGKMKGTSNYLKDLKQTSTPIILCRKQELTNYRKLLSDADSKINDINRQKISQGEIMELQQSQEISTIKLNYNEQIDQLMSKLKEVNVQLALVRKHDAAEIGSMTKNHTEEITQLKDEFYKSMAAEINRYNLLEDNSHNQIRVHKDRANQLELSLREVEQRVAKGWKQKIKVLEATNTGLRQELDLKLSNLTDVTEKLSSSTVVIERQTRKKYADQLEKLQSENINLATLNAVLNEKASMFENQCETKAAELKTKINYSNEMTSTLFIAQRTTKEQHELIKLLNGKIIEKDHQIVELENELEQVRKANDIEESRWTNLTNSLKTSGDILEKKLDKANTQVRTAQTKTQGWQVKCEEYEQRLRIIQRELTKEIVTRRQTQNQLLDQFKKAVDLKNFVTVPKSMKQQVLSLALEAESELARTDDHTSSTGKKQSK